MTAAQDAAIKQIREIAREHFDAAVFILQGEAVPDVGLTQEQCDRHVDVQYLYHGGYAASIGLVEMARHHIYNRGRNEDAAE